MKYFSPIKIAAILTCFLSASQVQGASASVLHPGYQEFHDDKCMVDHFGPTSSRQELAGENLVEAFIACPNQMATSYYEKLVLEHDDSLISAVRDSGKKDSFYAALENITRGEDSRSIQARAEIYKMSFIQGIPEHLYLNSLKSDLYTYIPALIKKASLCKTPEEKKIISDMLQEALTMIPQSADRSGYYANMVNYCIRLLNGDKFDFITSNLTERMNLFFMALSLNRYDVAEAASEGLKISLNTAIDFATKQSFEPIVDRARAVKLIKDLLFESGDRAAFDDHMARI